MKHPILLSAAVALAIVVPTCAWVWGAGDGGQANSGAPPASVAPNAHPAASIPGYDFAHPVSSFTLPAELAEVSALTDIDDHTVACVQDEIGAVFFIDLRSGAVTRRIAFGPDGDYEGLTRVDDVLWVLRSDGLMIELSMRGDALAPGRQVKLDIEHHDIEGLGYDPVDRVVLVAPKSSLKGDKAKRAQRQVFRFDPASGKRIDGLALDTTTDRVVADAEHAGIVLPTKATKRGKERVDLKVRFASIAVHPKTNKLFALSAVDRALLMFDRDGTLSAAHFFDEREMPKPEGITFLANGDMVIASEGVETPPRVQVLRYLEGRARDGR